VCVCEVVI